MELSERHSLVVVGMIWSSHRFQGRLMPHIPWILASENSWSLAQKPQGGDKHVLLQMARNDHGIPS